MVEERLGKIEINPVEKYRYENPVIFPGFPFHNVAPFDVVCNFGLLARLFDCYFPAQVF